MRLFLLIGQLSVRITAAFSLSLSSSNNLQSYSTWSTVCSPVLHEHISWILCLCKKAQYAHAALRVLLFDKRRQWILSALSAGKECILAHFSVTKRHSTKNTFLPTLNQLNSLNLLKYSVVLLARNTDCHNRHLGWISPIPRYRRRYKTSSYARITSFHILTSYSTP